MRRSQPSIGTPFAVAAVTVAGLGGLFFGLASCGGYAWHDRFFFWLLTSLVLAALLFPSRLLRSWPRRLLFPLLVVLTYVLVEATAAPFYPFAPESTSEFIRVFKRTLIDGPC
jgi:hypothetical protein